MRHILGFSIIALIFGLTTPSYARVTDKEAEEIYILSYEGVAKAKQCGDSSLARQLYAATFEYFSLHPAGLDTAYIRPGFDRRVELMGKAIGKPTICRLYLSEAREALSKTQLLIQKLKENSQGESPKRAVTTDSLVSINKLIMECNSDAIDVGEKIYQAKRSGLGKTRAMDQFERGDSVWQGKSVAAIYARSTTAKEAGDAAKLMCITEANMRLTRLTNQ